MKIEIDVVMNGIITKAKDTDGNDEIFVYQMKDDYDEKLDKHDHLTYLLWDIISSVGFDNSKHNKYRIEIKNVKNRSYKNE